MNKRIFLIFLMVILSSCGSVTNRKMAGEDLNGDAPIEDLRRDIASSKEPEIEKDPLNPSLWTGRGTDSYLFTNVKEKKLGDIILVDVYSKLRKEIGAELTIEAKASGYQEPEGEKEKQEAPKTEEAGSDDVPSDHISTVIEEEVNQTHFLLKGRKAVVYKGRKKLIEFKGLVARKDIEANDRVNSKNLLESTIKVLR